MARRNGYDPAGVSGIAEVIRDMPLWCAVVAAAAVYIILAFVPGFFEHGEGPANHVFSTLTRTAAPMLAGIVLASGLVGAFGRWSRGRRAQPAPPQLTAELPAGESPLCPRCGGPMARKTARRGASAGQDFWGCNRFPQCRGTRPA